MPVFQSVGSNYNFKQVLGHTFVVGGKKQQKNLEDFLIKNFNGQNAVLYHTGRAALCAAVKSLTGGSGKVIVNAFTCSVVVDAVRAAGCEVVYADIERETLHYSADNLNKLAKKYEIKVAIIQNSLGIPVAIEEFLEVSKKHNIKLIEDVAHAVGGVYKNGQAIGSVGDATVLSFGRDKMLDTVNGGALVMRNNLNLEVEKPNKLPPLSARFRDRFYPLIAFKARKLFSIGVGPMILRFSYGVKLAVRSADGGVHPQQKMTGWQARLGLKQLEIINQTVKKRKMIQGFYGELSELGLNESSSYVRLPLVVKNRDEVVKALKKQKFYFEDIWYDVPVAPARLYDKQDFPESENPVSTDVAGHILNLPTHSYVDEKSAKKIASIIKEVAKPWK